MSLWEFQAACGGYDSFHGGQAEEGSEVAPPSVDEWNAMLAKGPPSTWSKT